MTRSPNNSATTSPTTSPQPARRPPIHLTRGGSTAARFYSMTAARATPMIGQAGSSAPSHDAWVASPTSGSTAGTYTTGSAQSPPPTATSGPMATTPSTD